VVNVVLIKIVKKTRELTDYGKNDSKNTQEKNYIKLNRNSIVFNRSFRLKKNCETQPGLPDEFAYVKTEE